MVKILERNPRLQRLATQLECDIRSRQLGPGDRYLTGEAAGRLLGVSTAMANRAMSLLVEQQVLVRQPRNGTFVSSALGNTPENRIRTVHVLMNQHEAASFSSWDQFFKGIRVATDHANVQFSFLPNEGRLSYVRDLLGEPHRRGELVGVIPISSGRDVYRFLADSAIPTVVFGSLYSEKGPIASVDLDNRETGRLAIEFLVERGHRRMAVFGNSSGCPGDDDFSDGVNEALDAAGLPPGAVASRFAPDHETLVAQLQDLMTRELSPTGYVTRSPEMARVVGELVGGNPDIVFQDDASSSVELSPYPHIQPQLSYEEIAELIGKMLIRPKVSEDPQPQHVQIPVRLRIPE